MVSKRIKGFGDIQYTREKIFFVNTICPKFLDPFLSSPCIRRKAIPKLFCRKPGVACAYYCTYVYIHIRWYIDRTEHWFFSHTRIYVYYSFLYIVSTRYALLSTGRRKPTARLISLILNIVWQKEMIAATAREYEVPVTIRSISIGRNPPSLARRKKSRRRRRRNGSTGRPRPHPPTVTPARIPTTASNYLQTLVYISIIISSILNREEWRISKR